MKLLTDIEVRNKEFFQGALHTFGFPVPPLLRMIDKVAEDRRRPPLKLLCLGLSRSGTFSLFNALVRLGYRPYHMAEAIINAPIDFAIWQEAVNAKFHGIGPKFTRADFDKFLGGYDVIMEYPASLFAEELLELYPEAKVVLTHRPVKGWIKSMRESVYKVMGWSMWPYVAWADQELTAPWYKFSMNTFHIAFGDMMDTSADDSPDPLSTHPDSSTAKYLAYYDKIRRICPKDRLLEMELGDGYEQLCPFLGIDLPPEPYPRSNDKAMFIGLHQMMLNRATFSAVMKVSSVVVPVVAVGVGAWRYLRPRWS